MGSVVKIGLGIALGGILLLVGCGVLIAGSTGELSGGEDTALEDAGGGGSEPARSPQKTRRFSGNGSKNVGTIKVTDDAVLRWRNSGSEFGGGYFIVSDQDFKINVNSQGKRGKSALEPGTYRNVDVTADGDWSMTIEGR